MALSPKISRQPPGVTPSDRPNRRPSDGPFGGMNVRTADIRRAPHARSIAEVKRSSGGRERPEKSRGNGDTFHALKMQRALSPVSYVHRNAIKAKISEIQAFDHFQLLPVVKEAIKAQGQAGIEFTTPTPVQRLAIPGLLGENDRASRKRLAKGVPEEMEQFLLAAETGSGKTLAYLLPVIDAIKRAEANDADIEAHNEALEEEKRRGTSLLKPPPLSNQPHPTTGRPRAIILVPTSELVTQVGNVAKSLSHTIKFRSALLSSTYTGKVIRNRLFAPSGIDLLICTPHLLASISESDPNILSRVTRLVIDEADSLLDRSFAPSTSTIIDKSTPSLKQLILCSATIPRSLDNYLHTRFPSIRRLVTPNLHAIPRRVQLGVVDVDKETYRGNKSLACADTIWSIGKAAAEHGLSNSRELETEHSDVKRILVFVNERETAQEVAEYLESKGIDAVALSRDTPEARQTEMLSAFTSPARTSVPLTTPPTAKPDGAPNFVAAYKAPAPVVPQKRHLPNTKVLVTTDLGSRGIDTVAVRHVILYDVPHSTIDFIHRLGRTGRMGRRGRGIVLVGRGDRRDVVSEVKEGMFRGQALI